MKLGSSTQILIDLQEGEELKKLRSIYKKILKGTWEDWLSYILSTLSFNYSIETLFDRKWLVFPLSNLDKFNKIPHRVKKFVGIEHQDKIKTEKKESFGEDSVAAIDSNCCFNCKECACECPDNEDTNLAIGGAESFANEDDEEYTHCMNCGAIMEKTGYITCDSCRET